MKKQKMILSVLLSVLLLVLPALGTLGTSAAEVQYVELDLAHGHITIDEYEFVIGDSDPIEWSGNYIIKYTGGGENRLTVNGAKCRIIFDNVKISTLRQAVFINKKADVTLVLRGENEVVFSDTTKTGTAIAVGVESSLTIEAENGTDSLLAIGGAYGAGIGSTQDCFDVSARITINSGVITAYAGNKNASEAAGIGGARKGGAQIVINGGIINAFGVRNGPGIGAGREAPEGSTITINGGVITARPLDEDQVNANGIGGGFKSACSNITINGGVINAASGNVKCEGIGIGVDMVWSDKYTLNINGGSINSVRKNGTEPDTFPTATKTGGTAKLVATPVTLPEASTYLYVGDQAMLLEGTHGEGSNTYFLYLEEGATHKLAFANKEVTATAGVPVNLTDWTAAAAPVTAPAAPEAPEKDTVIAIQPSEIPAPEPPATAEPTDEVEPPATNAPTNEVTKPVTDRPTTPTTPTTNAPASGNTEKSGCGAAVGSSMALLTLISLAGVMLGKKK
ncbi:MAG: hypothetical protein E7620_04760 [Ruminococcaceae bacterium]|nr:hypothetical protein [Oscillospiraceae bacterium]